MSTFFTPRGTTLPPLTPETIPDSFSEPASGKRPWYRRTWVLVVVVLAVVAGASVVADLPHQATTSELTTEATALVKAVDADIRTCTYSVRQSYTIYGRQQAGTLTAAQRSQVPTLLSQNEQACSFANQAVVSLGTLTVPSGPAGPHLSAMITSVEVWMTSDAVAAMSDMQKLVAHPTDVSARRDLRAKERLLRLDRAKADRAIAAAERSLGGAHLPDPSLPVTPLG
jgi:hypothetical protein